MPWRSVFGRFSKGIEDRWAQMVAWKDRWRNWREERAELRAEREAQRAERDRRTPARSLSLGPDWASSQQALTRLQRVLELFWAVANRRRRAHRSMMLPHFNGSFRRELKKRIRARLRCGETASGNGPNPSLLGLSRFLKMSRPCGLNTPSSSPLSPGSWICGPYLPGLSRCLLRLCVPRDRSQFTAALMPKCTQ